MRETNGTMPLRVGYDAQAFLAPGGGSGGKGVQLRNLLGRHADRFTGFASTGKNYSDLPLVQKGFSGYRLWQQLSLPRLLRETKTEVFLAPYNTAPLLIPSKTKLVLVLHDTIRLEKFPDTGLRRRLRDDYQRFMYDRFLIRRAVSRADIILTVSEYSRREVLSYFPHAQVDVIPCSIHASWFDERALVPPSRRADYLLMVINPAPHKNLDRALEAYAQYAAAKPAELMKLRIVGMSGMEDRYRETFASLGVKDLITLEPFVSNEELQSLYRNARAVLMPSLMEGFGIPVLEAMSVGTPVISSNAASLPEVGGAAAYYFDPKSVDDMAAAIGKVLDNAGLREIMFASSIAQASNYHPSTVQARVDAFWSRIAHVHSS